LQDAKVEARFGDLAQSLLAFLKILLGLVLPLFPAFDEEADKTRNLNLARHQIVFVADQGECSGSSQESPDSRLPLSLRGIVHGDFARPCSREIDRRPDKKGEAFLRTYGPNLFVEFERFSGQVSAHVE
jgi:hypothetical protein